MNMVKTLILSARRFRSKLTSLCVTSAFALYIASLVYIYSQDDMAKFLLSASPTSIADLYESYRSAGLPPGTFERPVRLWGTIYTDAPLISTIGENPCVYFYTKVIRRWSYRTGSQTSRRTTFTYETLFKHSKHIDFWLQEGNDSIRIRTAGAKIHGIEIDYDDSPPQSAIERLRISKAPKKKGGKTHRGDDYTEYLLPIGQKLSVFGVATDRSGEFHIEAAEHLLLTTLPVSEELNFYRNSLWAKQIATFVIPISALCLLLGLSGKFLLTRDPGAFEK